MQLAVPRGMTLQLVIAVGTVLVAVAAGVALAHAVQPAPRTGDVPGARITRAQATVRRYALALGAVETLALLALLVALFLVPPRSTAMWLVGGAALCVAAMMWVWAAWLRPLNSVIVEWTPEAPPADWERHHVRWTAMHRVRVVLAIVALGLLLMSVFARVAH